MKTKITLFFLLIVIIIFYGISCDTSIKADYATIKGVKHTNIPDNHVRPMGAHLGFEYADLKWHKAGMLDPYGSLTGNDGCISCHGEDLKGGKTAEGITAPSCYTCHNQKWFDANKLPRGWDPEGQGFHNGSISIFGVNHKRGGLLTPEGNCTTCHGAELEGAVGPSCNTCHKTWPKNNLIPWMTEGYLNQNWLPPTSKQGNAEHIADVNSQGVMHHRDVLADTNAHTTTEPIAGNVPTDGTVDLNSADANFDYATSACKTCHASGAEGALRDGVTENAAPGPSCNTCHKNWD